MLPGNRPGSNVWLSFGIILILIIGVIGYQSWQRQQIPKDYVLPGDSFDAKTLQAVQSALDGYHVSTTAHNHEVYMVTGGLGIANPRLMGWDSDGNMSFGGNNSPSIYDIRESAQSPATWYTMNDGKGVSITNAPQAGYKPVPWVKHVENGVPYYTWDMIPHQSTYLYFEEGATYINVRIDNMGSPNAQLSIPIGLIYHMVPLGNPISTN